MCMREWRRIARWEGTSPCFSVINITIFGLMAHPAIRGEFAAQCRERWLRAGWIGILDRFGSIDSGCARGERDIGMIENRELIMDDYLAMLRRRLKVILIPALLAPLAGFAVSYVFPAKYTSQSLVLVEDSKIPDTVVTPVFNEDLAQHINTLSAHVMSPARLRPMVDRLGLVKGGENVGVGRAAC